MADIKIFGKDGLIDLSGGKNLDQLTKQVAGLTASFTSLEDILQSLKKVNDDVSDDLKDQAKALKDVVKAQKTYNKESEEAEKQAKDLNKAYKENEKLARRLDKAIEDLNKEREKAKTGTDAQTQAEKKLLQTKDRLNQALTKEAVEIQKVNNQIKQLKAEQRDQEILNSKTAGTLEKVAASSRKLRREREKLNLDTERGRKRLQEINKELDKNNKKVKDNSDALKKQRLNVGNYTDSIKEAAEQSGFFSREIAILQRIQGTLNAILKKNTIEQEANTVAKTTSTAATRTLTVAQKAQTVATTLGSKALKGFKIALASTGIGAIVLALGGLISFLTKTQGGIDSVERATKAATTTFDVLIDRLSGVGAGLSLIFQGDFSEGIDLIKEAFEGIGDEIQREVELVDDLTKALQKLRVETSQFIVQEANLRKEINELRLASEDDTKSINQRITALRQAFAKEEEIASKRKELLKEQLLIDITGGGRTETRADAERLINDIIAGRTKLQLDDLGTANSTVEDLTNANEKIAQIITAQSNQYSRQIRLQTKINSLQKQQEKTQEKTTKKKTEEVEKVEEEAKPEALDIKTKQEIEAQNTLLEALRANKKGNEEQQEQDEEEFQNKILQIQIDAAKKQLEVEDLTANEKLRAEKELNDLLIEEEERRIEKQNKLLEEQLEKEKAAAEQREEFTKGFAGAANEILQDKIKSDIARTVIATVLGAVESGEDPVAALGKAAFIKSALLSISAFEKGGLVEGGEQIVRINEKGQEFVVDAPTTKALGLDRKGATMRDFHGMLQNQVLSNDKRISDNIESKLNPTTQIINQNNIDYEKMGRTIAKHMPKEQLKYVGEHLAHEVYSGNKKEKTIFKNPNKILKTY